VTVTRVSTEAKTLYHYQATLFHRLRTAISEGHRDLLLHAPPAAGKTLTTQALIAHELDEGRFQLAVVLAPLETIRSRWTDEQVVAAPGGKLHTYKARPMRERDPCEIDCSSASWPEVVSEQDEPHEASCDCFDCEVTRG